MRLNAFFCFVFIVSQVHPQTNWTVPARITTGSNSEHGVAITSAPFWANTSSDWMAFVRNNREICMRRTETGGTSWSDSVYCIPNDSAQFSHPSLTYTTSPGSPEPMMVLVWESNEYPLPNSSIRYAVYQNSVWSPPLLLTGGSAADHNPQVAQNDTGVGVVWEREGRIMYSRFSSSGWSLPEFVTGDGDTLNHRPTILQTWAAPIVVWERHKGFDTTYAIMCSKKGVSQWTSPDTIAYDGDNRDPAFFKTLMGPSTFAVAWSRASGPFRQVVARRGFYNGDELVLQNTESLSQWQIQGINTNPVVNDHPIPISNQDPTSIWYLASAWQTRSAGGGNGIAASIWAGSSYTLLGGPDSTTYQNPDVSGGVYDYPYLRVWIVWEGQQGNLRKLYGSRSDFWLTSVDKLDDLPNGFGLLQNYPNPFNPSTTIEYNVPTSGLVSIRIFDVLGREVAALVDEKKNAGRHQATWNADNLTGGVYFYRLVSGSVTRTTKMLLIR